MNPTPKPGRLDEATLPTVATDALSILATEAAKGSQPDTEPDAIVPTGLAPVPGTGVSA